MKLVSLETLQLAIDQLLLDHATIGYSQDSYYAGFTDDGYLVVYKKGGKRRPYVEVSRRRIPA